ncbi:CWF19-like protein 1 homolog [Drosophila bipectinata]|uniref:CWF19-like protein 1 homolog n=1 Tax=Drosophila bipectinata TaxID=42026 RepID=UPI001C8A021C|nr:CWF19-like protein 1 homolog [Drosophila bipectinata]
MDERNTNAFTKILLIGDVRGRFNRLFQRVEQANGGMEGPFDLLFCIGDFFGDDKQNDELMEYYINGFKRIPLPTYVLGPTKKEQAKYYEDLTDGGICPNLHYLGKRGIYTTSNGVKVAYLSGVEATGTKNSEHEFTKDDVNAVKNACLDAKNRTTEYRGVDVLLTSQWPYGVQEEQNASASKLIAYLCREIKPRYHFCAINGINYHSALFRMPKDDTTQLELSTRFIPLGEVGNANKAKYIFGLKLKSVEKFLLMELLEKTTDEIPSPFIGLDLENSKRKLQPDDQNTKNQKRPKLTQNDEEKCLFCLSSPDVEKHLFITIGKDFYLALSKSPINKNHVVIVSTKHVASAAQLSSEEWEELGKFKTALKEYFGSIGQVVCFTEGHYKSVHLVINAMAFEKELASKLKQSFEEKAKDINLEFETLAALNSPKMLPKMGTYFVAELPNDTTLIMREMKNCPIHFDREVFCSKNLLDCEENINYNDCLMEKGVELRFVEEFKNDFEPFDFTEF